MNKFDSKNNICFLFYPFNFLVRIQKWGWSVCACIFWSYPKLDFDIFIYVSVCECVVFVWMFASRVLNFISTYTNESIADDLFSEAEKLRRFSLKSYLCIYKLVCCMCCTCVLASYICVWCKISSHSIPVAFS